MAEIATAWVTLAVSAQGMQRDVTRALNRVDGTAAGRRAGQQLSRAAAGATNLSGIEQQMLRAGQRGGELLSKGLKVGAAAGIAALGLSLKGGLDRLTAIDDARGKLRGLGHDASAQAKIMDSALAAVKGTAFGLGDAATISASAVAAGIKPGQDLTKYLKMTADAATIAGSSLSDMGSIINQVQTGGSAMTDDLNQLADRGIPIYQWLGQEMHATGAEVKDLASKGKISSEIFFQAIQKNIGGAALESGKTVRGSFANMKAAMGRFGAALEEPAFKRAPATFASITSAIDTLTPKAGQLAASFDAKVFGDWVPDAKAKLEDLKADPDFQAGWAEAKQTFESLAGAIGNVAGPLADIGSSLATASASLGVSTWQLFVTALETAAGVLNMLAGPLQTLADLMRDNQGVVTALAGAWLAFRTVPAILSGLRTGITQVGTAAATTATRVERLGQGIGRTQGAFRTLGSRLTTTRGFVSDFGSAYRTNLTYLRQANPTITTASAHMRTLGSVSRSVGTTAMSSLRRGASGVMGALGGPWGAAFAVAGIAAMGIISKNQKSAQSMEALKEAIDNTSKAQTSLNEALYDSNGSTTNESVVSAEKDRLQAFMGQLEAASTRTGSFLDLFRVESDGRYKSDVIAEAADDAKEAKQALDNLKMSQDDLAGAVYGSQAAFEMLVAKLHEQGEGGDEAARGLADARIEMLKVQENAANGTPGINQMADAMQVLGDKTATAADKSKALKQALDALNPERSRAATAGQFGESARTAGQGLAPITLDQGKIDETSAGGSALVTALSDLADKAGAYAVAGGKAEDITKQLNAAFGQLASASGQPIETIRKFYMEYGGEDAQIVIGLSGAPEAVQQIGTVARAMEGAGVGETKFIPISIDDETKHGLELIGLKVDRLPDGKGINVTANTAAAQQMLNSIIGVVSALPPGKKLDVSAPGAQGVIDLLNSVGGGVRRIPGTKDIEVTSPSAPGVKQLLDALNLTTRSDNGKNIVVRQEGAQATQTALQETKDAADAIPNKKVVTIEVRRQSFDAPAPAGPGGVVPPILAGARHQADGGIVPMALGGLRWIRKPTTAGLYAGRGAGTVFAEEETGGEAYVPLAESKRPRSTAILAEVARRFGLALVDPRNAFRSFADGGITVDELKAFASGIAGAQYTWGGSPDSWATDCCLVADTMVWGPNGPSRIVDLRRGDLVFSFEGGKLTVNTVSAQWFSKDQETFKVRTRRRSVTGSANHPFLTLAVAEAAKPKRGSGRVWHELRDTLFLRGWTAKRLSDLSGVSRSVLSTAISGKKPVSPAVLNKVAAALALDPTDLDHDGNLTTRAAQPARYDVQWKRLDELRRGDLLIQPKDIRPDFVANTQPSGRPGIAEWIDAGDFDIAPVLDVTPQGVQATFDIEVDGAHNFIADGVVVHNSGAQSRMANFITGADGRFATGSEGAQLAARGFMTGAPPEGTAAYWIGWENGGPGGGHTAGTIVDPDGGNVNVEMGGANGGGAYGAGAAGAADFPNQAWISLQGQGGTDGGGRAALSGAASSSSSAAVTGAQSAVAQANAGVTRAQAAVDQAQAKVDDLTAKGAPQDKIDAAQKDLKQSQDKLTAAQEQQTTANDRLTKAKEAEAEKTDKASDQSSQGSMGQSFGQGVVSGLLQAIGLDGSLFSNPFEWPNVKSAMALANYGGSLAKALGGKKTGDTSGEQTFGEGAASGAASGIGLNLPNVTDFMKPVQPQTPIKPANDPTQQSSGKGGVDNSVTFQGNVGMDPKAVTSAMNARQNAAWRRNSGAHR